MDAAGIYPIMEYIGRIQAAIAEKVACHPIYKLCVEAEHMPGTSRMMTWWYQDIVNETE